MRLFNKGEVTTISENTNIKGSIESNADIDVFGTVKSEGVAILSKANVSINTKAEVEGGITANGNVSVLGTVKGDIISNGVAHLVKGCSLHGNIKARRVNMEDGVQFVGLVEIVDSEGVEGVVDMFELEC